MGINSTNESGKPNNQKQKSHSHELSRRNLSSNLPSRKNDAAKIHINRETAIVNLEKLEKSYQQNNKIRGFLICIKSALGLKPTQGASGYGIVSIPQNDGAVLEATISPTNHHANAQTYIDNDCNLEYNLKISVRKKQMRGKFKPHKDVVLDKYKYTGKEFREMDSALTLIIRSIHHRFLGDRRVRGFDGRGSGAPVAIIKKRIFATEICGIFTTQTVSL